MWHLFKHSSGRHKGKYDVAFVMGGKRFILGSNQGYSKKQYAINAIILTIGCLGVSTSIFFQDDTNFDNPVVYQVSRGEKPVPHEYMSPHKPYNPSNSKKKVK